MAAYVQEIAGVALASGLADYDRTRQNSYQVLAMALNSANITNLPQDLKNAIGDLVNYAPNPYAPVQPCMSAQQIEKMAAMASKIDVLMRVKYGVNLQKRMSMMFNALKNDMPNILRSCGLTATQLPATTLFRPRLGRAISEAYARLNAKNNPDKLHSS